MSYDLTRRSLFILIQSLMMHHLQCNNSEQFNKSKCTDKVTGRINENYYLHSEATGMNATRAAG